MILRSISVSYATFLRVLMLSFFAIFSPSVYAGDKPQQPNEPLLWYVWDLPPEFIHRGPWKGRGYADKFLAFFMHNLPGYDHHIRVVNIPRWSREVLKPNRCSVHLWSGFFPGELIESKPYSFTPPHVVIFHKRHQKRIGPKGTVVSLEALLKQPDLKLMIMNVDFNREARQSRYPVLYPYLLPYVGQENLIEQYSTENTVDLDLLAHGRADYTIAYPSTIKAQMRIKNLPDEYVSYPLKEHNIYKNVYVACRNDTFGQKVIRQINALLTEETLLEFLSYHEEWNDADPNFRKTTIDYFVKNMPLENVVE
ncbi:hypothetical protein [uncultured Kiloniella sp.]|uniref:hypothetical protein n=1 Tax=uncultured Kiloniella sp. TaxID=1133091 RepID=UPI00263585E0|nr:hypothetical protein [uncultured Kiloniella sp.]